MPVVLEKIIRAFQMFLLHLLQKFPVGKGTDRIASGGKQELKTRTILSEKDTKFFGNGENDMAVDTPERSSLWAIHTPQGFSYPLILEAHERFRQGDYRIPVTDDTMLAEIFLRKKAKLVRGSYKNIKVTTPEDLPVAELYLKGV